MLTSVDEGGSSVLTVLWFGSVMLHCCNQLHAQTSVSVRPGLSQVLADTAFVLVADRTCEQTSGFPVVSVSDPHTLSL